MSPVEAVEVLRGAVFLLASPMALAALAGMVSAGWGGASWSAMAAAAALGATVVLWLPMQWFSLTPVLVIGLGALGASRALRWRPNAMQSLAVSVAAGMGAGLAAEFHWATPAEVLGGVAAVLVVGGLLLGSVRMLERRSALRPVLCLALAVAGAWVLALAVLVLLHGLR